MIVMMRNDFFRVDAFSLDLQIVYCQTYYDPARGALYGVVADNDVERGAEGRLGKLGSDVLVGLIANVEVSGCDQPVAADQREHNVWIGRVAVADRHAINL